jgi:hypothetical protein
VRKQQQGSPVPSFQEESLLELTSVLQQLSSLEACCADVVWRPVPCCFHISHCYYSLKGCILNIPSPLTLSTIALLPVCAVCVYVCVCVVCVRVCLCMCMRLCVWCVVCGVCSSLAIDCLHSYRFCSSALVHKNTFASHSCSPLLPYRFC